MGCIGGLKECLARRWEQVKDECQGSGSICGGRAAKAFDKKNPSSVVRVVLVALVALTGLVLLGVGVMTAIAVMGSLAPGLSGIVATCCIGSIVSGVLLLSWSLNYGCKIKKATNQAFSPASTGVEDNG